VKLGKGKQIRLMFSGPRYGVNHAARYAYGESCLCSSVVPSKLGQFEQVANLQNLVSDVKGGTQTESV
jgi:hypothetical protein